MEIQVKYRFYGQGKIVQWLTKKIKTLKKKLQCKISKCLNQITFKKHLTNCFYVLWPLKLLQNCS